MNGVDLVTVSKLLGHSTIQMTMRYSLLSPERQAKAVGVLDGAFEFERKKVDTKWSQGNISRNRTKIKEAVTVRYVPSYN